MRELRVITSNPEPHAAVRYALRLPVIFHWGDQMMHVEGGFTKEIGTHEAFVFSDICPPTGSPVRLEVLLPLPDSVPGTLRIECVGRVTQVVREDGCTGFLFHGRFYEGKIQSGSRRSVSESLRLLDDSGED